MQSLANNIHSGNGMKADGGKRQWCLMPWHELGEVADVLTDGAKKYSPDNWKKVTPKSRYESALMRHITSYFEGDKKDSEDGRSHLAHAICNILFLMWFDNNKETEFEKRKKNKRNNVKNIGACRRPYSK